MISHIRTAGMLMTAYGVIMSLVMGAIVTLMGGLTSLLAVVGVVDDPDALVGAAIYAVFTVVVAVLGLFVPVACIVSGVGLLRERPWARLSSIVVSCFLMMNIPVGLLIGGFVLFVMVDKDVTAHLTAGEEV